MFYSGTEKKVFKIFEYLWYVRRNTLVKVTLFVKDSIFHLQHNQINAANEGNKTLALHLCIWPGPKVIKLFFVLNSTEYVISNAH